MNSIETVFEWLLAASLRASVLAIAVIGIQFVLRHRLPAAWRHALWLPMLAVLVLPVLPEVPFALFPRKAPEPAPAVAEMLVETVATALVAEPIEITAPALPLAAAPVIPSPTSTAKVNVLAILWLSGACGVLVAGWIGYRRNMRRIRLTATLPTPFSPASSPAIGSFNGLHAKSKFLAIMNIVAETIKAIDDLRVSPIDACLHFKNNSEYGYRKASSFAQTCKKGLGIFAFRQARKATKARKASSFAKATADKTTGRPVRLNGSFRGLPHKANSLQPEHRDCLPGVIHRVSGVGSNMGVIVRH